MKIKISKVTKAISNPSSIAGGVTGFLAGGPAGAVIGAGLGSYMNAQQEKELRAQNKANQQAIDRANAYDLQMWNMANAYNDPKAQMQRLAAAGLNPNLVYGSGNVTGNTAGAPSSNGYIESARSNKFANAVQMAQMSANLASTRQEISKSQAQEDYTKAQTKNLTNFLDGNGPSTFTRPDSSVPVLNETPETTDDFLYGLANRIVDFAPQGVRTPARKLLKLSKDHPVRISLPTQETYGKVLPSWLFKVFTRR